MSLLLNILWLIFGGFFVSMGYIAGGIALCFTIIGIPFAIQHLKLAGISLAPIGKTVVDKEVAAAAREANAQDEVEYIRANR